jgi:hypothetical protein
MYERRNRELKMEGSEGEQMYERRNRELKRKDVKESRGMRGETGN